MKQIGVFAFLVHSTKLIRGYSGNSAILFAPQDKNYKNRQLQFTTISKLCIIKIFENCLLFSCKIYCEKILLVHQIESEKKKMISLA